MNFTITNSKNERKIHTKMQMTQTKEIYYLSPDVLQYNNVKHLLKTNNISFKNRTINADTYCAELLRLLKIINAPSKQKCMSVREYASHICNSYAKLYNDKKTTLSRYYKEMINDSLKLIRKGKVAYLYKEEHIEDVLRFEPEINVTYDGTAFCVSLLDKNKIN